MKTNCCNTRHIHVIEKRKICVNPDCDQYLEMAGINREFKGLKYILVSGLFIFSVLFTFEDFSYQNEYSIANLSVMEPQPELLTLETLKAELERQQVLCAGEVLAQIRLETGNLNSMLLKRTNNLMGMRFPYRRKTTAMGIFLPEQNTIIPGTSADLKKYAKENHYAAYKTWQDAVADYKLWQDAHFKMTDRYLEFLGKVYAEDSLYVQKIRSMSAKSNAADQVASVN